MGFFKNLAKKTTSFVVNEVNKKYHVDEKLANMIEKGASIITAGIERILKKEPEPPKPEPPKPEPPKPEPPIGGEPTPTPPPPIGGGYTADDKKFTINIDILPDRRSDIISDIIISEIKTLEQSLNLNRYLLQITLRDIDGNHMSVSHCLPVRDSIKEACSYGISNVLSSDISGSDIELSEIDRIVFLFVKDEDIKE